MSEESDLRGYYARRAADYERIYARPERQADLSKLSEHLRLRLAGRDVLEVACGTGYWTAIVAPAARSVLATDVGEEVLAVARAKAWPGGRVRFAQADAFSPGGLGGPFSAGLSAFWWSHVKRRDLPRFLGALHAELAPGAVVVHADNRFVPGSSTPIHRTDAAGNTWQIRRLSDGSAHEILKNFPMADELRSAVAPWADHAEVLELTYFWCLTYRLGGEAGSLRRAISPKTTAIPK